MWGSDSCFSSPPTKGRSCPTNTAVFPPSSFVLLSFVWFYIFFSTGQVLLSTLSWCSACTSVSEGVFLMYPWREMYSMSTYSPAILFSPLACFYVGYFVSLKGTFTSLCLEATEHERNMLSLSYVLCAENGQASSTCKTNPEDRVLLVLFIRHSSWNEIVYILKGLGQRSSAGTFWGRGNFYWLFLSINC